MNDDSSKLMLRRSTDHRYATRWIIGDGIDIGAGGDRFPLFSNYFPLVKSLRTVDASAGDVTQTSGIEAGTYDFVHVSRCLESVADPFLAIQNWLRICKPNGHLIVTVFDEDLYEQGIWPSSFNADHKWTFTILKQNSWSPKSISIVKLLERFASETELLKLEKLDAGFIYGRPRCDQTRDGASESAIEFVLKKCVRPSVSSSSDTRDIGEYFPAVVRRQQIADLFGNAVRHHVGGRLQEAKSAYEWVINAEPTNLAALNNLSLLLDAGSAEKLLCRALEIDSNYFDALLNLGSLLQRTKKADQAIPYLQRAYRSNPKDVRSVLLLCEIFDAANNSSGVDELLSDLTVLDPCPSSIYVQLAKYCENANLTDTALRCLDLALGADQNNAEAHVYRGRQLLKKGLYETGAAEIEWIWHGRIQESQRGLFVDADQRQIKQDGKTIVLSADSGLGDSIQFVRYARELKKLGATVVVECQKELLRLFGNLEYIDQVVEQGFLTNNYDVRVPFHNLLIAFRSSLETVPNKTPYVTALRPDVDAFKDRIAKCGKGFRLGLFWSGNPSHPRNSIRSIPLDMLSRLLDKKGLVGFSLQKESAPSIPNLVDFSEFIVDMASTAALVENMDLVIAGDSSVAHLAAAQGKPTWLLNRYDSCWRWGEKGESSQWYPSLRQFRQSHPGDWVSVIDSVDAELVGILGRKGR